MKSEVRCAFTELASGKSPGDDEIPIELGKDVEGEAVTVTTRICNHIWRPCRWSKRRNQSVYISLPKKGNAKRCYKIKRKIALTSNASIILLKVIQYRLEIYMEREI